MAKRKWKTDTKKALTIEEQEALSKDTPRYNDNEEVLEDLDVDYTVQVSWEKAMLRGDYD